MPARKMRVELFDSEGNRYSISFEGQVTRDKAVRLLDLGGILGGVPEGGGNSDFHPTLAREPTKYDNIRAIVQKHFPLVWFCSKDVQTVFEQEFRQPIGLSTVATYPREDGGKEATYESRAI